MQWENSCVSVWGRAVSLPQEGVATCSPYAASSGVALPACLQDWKATSFDVTHAASLAGRLREQGQGRDDSRPPRPDLGPYEGVIKLMEEASSMEELDEVRPWSLVASCLPGTGFMVWDVGGMVMLVWGAGGRVLV